MGKLPLRARLAILVGSVAGRASRLTGRGDGSVIGGVLSLRLEPNLLRLLSADRQVVLVTGTNGKTTTTRLITAALGALGQDVATNAFGANMEAGLVSALSRARRAPFAVLETDEKFIPAVLKTTGARVVTLLNLSRDQMDRAAEIWMVARRWREALAAAPRCQVIANADDPLIVWAASGAPRVTWVAAGQRWHEDSWCCPVCGSHLRRDELGWRCGECSFTRPSARWVLDGSKVSVTIDLASVKTGDEQRDSSLPSGDWFDVAEHPKATFTATKFTKTAEGRFVAHGTLSLRGVSKPLDLPFRLKITGDTATVSGVTSLDRTVFGVGQGEWKSTDQIPAKVSVSVSLKAKRSS